jgi:prolyl-tRNA synthetase
MLYSKMLSSTSKEKPAGTEAVSHSLSIMAGLVSPVASGFYTFSPMGQRVINKIESLVRKAMDDSGALEIAMPTMQPAALWKQSGRFETYGKEMMQLNDREGRTFFLAPTQEEAAVSFVKDRLNSYKQLPVTVYQIGKKFRDEKRPRNGIIRAKEFLMKDAYSFDKDLDGLDKSYTVMRGVYTGLFNTFSLKYATVSAETGEMGGRFSEEFMAFSPTGEDTIARCVKCNMAEKPQELQREELVCKQCNGKLEICNAIEIGHIFKLGTRYSVPFDLTYQSEEGQKKQVEMGCYGIGITRMMAAIIEQNNDAKGIIWPVSVAPFQFAVIPISLDNAAIRAASEWVERTLRASGYDVILDDRDLSGGKKFKDADLLGFPYKIIIGERGLRDGKVEIEIRRDDTKTMVPIGTDSRSGQFLEAIETLMRA